MPGYVQATLDSFMHIPSSRPQYTPHPWVKLNYGVKVQLTDIQDEPADLPTKEITYIQQVVGKFYYYARAIDYTMLVILGELTTQHTAGTVTGMTMDKIIWLLNYVYTHPNTKIRYHASEMFLHIDSDASYLSVCKAHSRVGGHYILSSSSQDPAKPPTFPPTPSSPLHVTCNFMRHIMDSAAISKYAGLFFYGKEAVVLRTILE